MKFGNFTPDLIVSAYYIILEINILTLHVNDLQMAEKYFTRLITDKINNFMCFIYFVKVRSSGDKFGQFGDSIQLQIQSC